MIGARFAVMYGPETINEFNELATAQEYVDWEHEKGERVRLYVYDREERKRYDREDWEV